MKIILLNKIFSIYQNKMETTFKYENKENDYYKKMLNSFTTKISQLLYDVSINPLITERAKISINIFREVNKYSDKFESLLHHCRNMIYLFITIKYKIYEILEEYNRGVLKGLSNRLTKSLMMEMLITEKLIENILTYYNKNYGNIKETRTTIYVYHNQRLLFCNKKFDKNTKKWSKINYPQDIC